MVKKNLCIYVILFIFLIMAGCYVGPRRFNIPKENYERNYNKMFDTAITAGAANGFHVIHQDRRLGIINLEDAGRGKDKANIDIQFFKAKDGNYIGQIELRTSTGDPILGGLQSKMRDSIQASIMEASRVSGTESKPETPITRQDMDNVVQLKGIPREVQESFSVGGTRSRYYIMLFFVDEAYRFQTDEPKSYTVLLNKFTLSVALPQQLIPLWFKTKYQNLDWTGIQTK